MTRVAGSGLRIRETRIAWKGLSGHERILQVSYARVSLVGFVPE